MDEHLPFLKAIAANPADDLPRLVFADFLEESGEPDAIARAHFIRAQIALTQLTPSSAEFRETVALNNRLFRLYRDDWMWDLPESLHTYGQPQWNRGCIEFASLSWREFVAGKQLFETVPITRVQIHSIRFDHDTTPELLDGRPYIRRVTHLRLGPHLYDANDTLLFLLLQSRNFAGLTHLDLTETSHESANLASFILRFGEAAFARTLDTLDLSANHGLDDAVGNALSTSSCLESIAHLKLRKSSLSEPVQAMLRRRFGDRVAF